MIEHELTIEDKSKFEVPRYPDDTNLWQKIMDLRSNTKHLHNVKTQRTIRATNGIIMPPILLPQSMEREQRLLFCDYASYHETKK